MPSWLKQSTTPYHQQDQPDYCGPAVAQMLLEAMGEGIGDQRAMFDGMARTDPADPCPGDTWFTAPIGLANALNTPTARARFAPRYFTDQDTALIAIAHALSTSAVAPAAVVYGQSHWVVVSGVQSDARPDPGAPAGILGFFINDPLPQTPAGSTMPPPHAAHDRCGSGGTGGVADQYVTLEAWRRCYFTGWQCAGGAQHHFAAVYAGGGEAAAGVHAPPHVPPDRYRDAAWRSADDATLISEAAAQLAAVRGIAAHELAVRGPLAGVLAGASPREAWLVENLGRDGACYYLVVLYAAGVPVATARVDARDGSFLGAIGAPASILGPHDVHARVHQGVQDLVPDTTADEVAIAPRLAWQFSIEFPSPYYPFYHVNARGTRYYAGSTGRVHRTLTRRRRA